MAAHARDRGIGLAVVLSLLAVGGAIVMYLSPHDPLAGWAFGFAMLAATLAVVAAQAYE